MLVHRIQAHTYLGYLKQKHIHHIDCNPLNNALSNLQYITNSEHSHIHNATNPPMKGKLHSEETKQKMSDAHKGNKTALGYHHTIEAKCKISTALKGNTHKLGKYLSEETKQKIREVNKGKVFTEDHKQKISAANKGKRKGFHWWTNFKESLLTDKCPGDEWVKGRILHK